jgi:hypothetical protein
MLLHAKAIRENIFGAESSQAALILVRLANLARERGNLFAAESLYTHTLNIFRSSGQAERSPNVQEVHSGLVTLYTQWGKPDKAAEHRAALLVQPR